MSLREINRENGLTALFNFLYVTFDNHKLYTFTILNKCFMKTVYMHAKIDFYSASGAINLAMPETIEKIITIELRYPT